METLQFKTNINCSGCVAKVTPELNETEGIWHWNVDTNSHYAAECNHCATACLEEQDVAMLAKCIKLDIDCAEI